MGELSSSALTYPQQQYRLGHILLLSLSFQLRMTIGSQVRTHLTDHRLVAFWQIEFGFKATQQTKPNIQSCSSDQQITLVITP